MSDLLPPNSSWLEHAAAKALAESVNLPVPMRDIWNPDTCPIGLLPWLAWAYSVDEWVDEWTEAQKRATVKESLLIHRRKGTLWSVKRILKNMGFAVEITEGLVRRIQYDGGHKFDGSYQYGGLENQWASYCVSLVSRPISNAEGAAIYRALAATAPVRCRLEALDFSSNPVKYDRIIRYDGSYKYGRYQQ